MKYGIIRNEKYTKNTLNLLYRHDERKNTNYSNKDIDRSKSHLNYSIKSCNAPYTTKFKEIKEKYNLQGMLKNTSNIVCEYIITASPSFFDEISEEEQKRYFETAYKFICGFKNLGEQYIISARVHLDENTPHMHLIYLPIVHTKNKQGENIDKLCCSEFWKGKNSYKILQDNFYNYMTKSGFKLDRGDIQENKHIKIADLKRITHFDLQKLDRENIVKPIETNDVLVLEKEYKKVILKYNTLKGEYTKVKSINETIIEENQKIQVKNITLQNNLQKAKLENITLENIIKKQKQEIYTLKNYIQKMYIHISSLFNFPIEKLKKLIDRFIKEYKEYEPINKR